MKKNDIIVYDCDEQEEGGDDMGDFVNEETEEFGCLYGAACCMPGVHFPSGCHTPEMLADGFPEEKRSPFIRLSLHET